jgi:hypothetical protein
VLRAAGKTEITQKIIQDWLELDEVDPGYQLPTEEEICSSDIKGKAILVTGHEGP